MGLAGEHTPPDNHSISFGPLTESSNSDNCSVLSQGSNEDEKCPVCRVCHCIESDRRGDAALDFLNITPPFPECSETDGIHDTKDKIFPKDEAKDVTDKDRSRGPGFVEFVSPVGEVFVCNADIETGSCYQQDALIELGCSCKGDISLAHYACALKWFVNHGSTCCEICGNAAKNIRPEDFKKVMTSLKDYESLRERTAAGQLAHVHVSEILGVDPDAVAAIRRQRLCEISSWFNPHNTPTAPSQPNTDQSSVNLQENIAPMESPATKWAVEGTGILVATGLLTVILAWLIAPRVGKKTAKNGLHILLGGVCALTVVIFLRFFVLSRIKYGPARYWAILFVFWFLVFGIWASRTHGAHTT